MSSQKKGVTFTNGHTTAYSKPGNEYSRFNNFNPTRSIANARRQLASKGYNPHGSFIGRSAELTAAAPNYIWRLKPKGGRRTRRNRRTRRK
jgi:hypothetical protein